MRTPWVIIFLGTAKNDHYSFGYAKVCRIAQLCVAKKIAFIKLDLSEAGLSWTVFFFSFHVGLCEIKKAIRHRDRVQLPGLIQHHTKPLRKIVKF